MTTRERLAIDVVQERRISRDGDRSSLRHRDSWHLSHSTREQPPGVHQDLPCRPVIHDDEVELAIVQLRVRGNQSAVAILTGVRNRNHQRSYTKVMAIRRECVVRGHERRHLTRCKFEVPDEAAAIETAGGKSMGHTAVEPEAGNVEEQVAVELAGVDEPLTALEDHLEG